MGRAFRRYHSDSKLLTLKKSRKINNEDDMKYVQYMDNDDNNHTNLLIDNINKFHLNVSTNNVNNHNISKKKMCIEGSENHKDIIKNQIFSVLNQLQQKYPNHQQLFFNVLDQYIKQKKK